MTTQSADEKAADNRKKALEKNPELAAAAATDLGPDINGPAPTPPAEDGISSSGEPDNSQYTTTATAEAAIK